MMLGLRSYQHNIYNNSRHYGWHDINPLQREQTAVLRGFLTGYKMDEKGRVRWSLETRNGAKYNQVEILVPAGFMTAPKCGDMVEAMVLDVGGDAGHLTVIPIGDSSLQQRLPEGWSGVASPVDPNTNIQFDDQGNIYLNGNITIEGNITQNGNIKQDGQISSTGVHSASAHV